MKIDTLTVSWAIHRLAGISSPANAAYSADELVYQLKSSGSKALFTCLPVLDVALEAASKVGIPKHKIFILEMPEEFTGRKENSSEFEIQDQFKTVGQLISDGKGLAQIEHLHWEKGRGARQTAFLCYSSGTSGLPVSTHVL